MNGAGPDGLAAQLVALLPVLSVVQVLLAIMAVGSAVGWVFLFWSGGQESESGQRGLGVMAVAGIMLVSVLKVVKEAVLLTVPPVAPDGAPVAALPVIPLVPVVVTLVGLVTLSLTVYLLFLNRALRRSLQRMEAVGDPRRAGADLCVPAPSVSPVKSGPADGSGELN